MLRRHRGTCHPRGAKHTFLNKRVPARLRTSRHTRTHLRYMALPLPTPRFIELARAVPETTMILDHFGTPLGVGPFAGQREAIFEQWKSDIAALAECPNVFMKLGGSLCPITGSAGMDVRCHRLQTSLSMHIALLRTYDCLLWPRALHV